MAHYIIGTLFVVGVLSAFAVFVFGTGRLSIWIVSDAYSFDTLMGVSLFGAVLWFVVFMALLETGLSVPYKAGDFYEAAPFWIYLISTFVLSTIVVARAVKQYKQEKHAFG